MGGASFQALMASVAAAGGGGGGSKAIDGTAGGQFSTTNTGTVTLSTTQSNDVIVLMYFHQNSTHAGVQETVSAVTSSNLTWTKRNSNSWLDVSANTYMDLEIWWAQAASPLASEVITITLTGAIDDAAYQAFGVSGCSTPSAPWDANASLATAYGTSGTTSVAVSGVSTTSTNPMVIGAWGSMDNAAATLPSGVTAVRAPQQNAGGFKFAYMDSFYESYAAAVSSASYTTTNAAPVHWGEIIDALA